MVQVRASAREGRERIAATILGCLDAWICGFVDWECRVNRVNMGDKVNKTNSNQARSRHERADDVASQGAEGSWHPNRLSAKEPNSPIDQRTEWAMGTTGNSCERMGHLDEYGNETSKHGATMEVN